MVLIMIISVCHSECQSLVRSSQQIHVFQNKTDFHFVVRIKTHKVNARMQIMTFYCYKCQLLYKHILLHPVQNKVVSMIFPKGTVISYRQIYYFGL